MIKVLLTGANGQIGSEIKRSAPDFVTLYSYDKRTLDITSIDTVKTVFAECNPDYVINTAAYTAVDQAEKEPELAYAINAMGVLHLAEACQKASIPLIHISTDYIFNGHHNQPYSETDVAAPLNVYGKSKWEGEQAVRHVLPEHIILRTSWVFGYFGKNFVKTILRLARDQDLLRIVSDQYGCPTAATDIALVIWQIIRQISQKTPRDIPWGTYHFTNMHEVSWYDFAKKILVIAERYTTLACKDILAITTADYPTLAKRPVYSVLNCQKIMDYFHVVPRHWEIGLNELIDSL
jgi:dTDP-4-dehydrorhamnose reductase